MSEHRSGEMERAEQRQAVACQIADVGDGASLFVVKRIFRVPGTDAERVMSRYAGRRRLLSGHRSGLAEDSVPAV
jgi:hypothetical protein